jgi:predicted DCC family thiol-disulfide oxidoreductase YuxK
VTAALQPPTRPGAGPAVWTLLYDGDCTFCRRCVAALAAWDRRRRLRFVPFQDAVVLAALPGIPRAALEQAMHLVSPDGTLAAGAAAAPAILRLLPGGRVLTRLFAVPGVPRVAAQLYTAVARNRHRLGCGSGTCSRGHR